jgi:hypothetical protein
MAIIVGIDGTGGGALPTDARDRQYDIDFERSFVRRIANGGGANSMYLRGPVTMGGGLVDAVNNGFNFIIGRLASGVREPILLTGYSRGAAGVVAIAKKLQDQGKNVRALLMFDCVDRHITIDAERVPTNVANVMHVIRDPLSESRESFGNAGLAYSPPTNYPTPTKFLCTHGGMGGCPWVTPIGHSPSDFVDEGFPDNLTTISYLQDAQISQTVWAFVQPFMRTHGFI